MMTVTPKRISDLGISIKKFNLSIQAKVHDITYYSNYRECTIFSPNISIQIKSETEGQYIKEKDIVEYNIEVQNQNKNKEMRIGITDFLSKYLKINEITINNLQTKEYEYYLQDDREQKIVIYADIKPNETIYIKIKAQVQDIYEEIESNRVNITNKANVTIEGKLIAESNEIDNIITIEDKDKNPDDGNGDKEPENPDDKPDNKPDDNVKKYMLSGNAWLDNNENGRKDEQEEILKGIKVKLLEIKTGNFVKDSNNKEIEAITNDKGFYEFEGIAKGKYILVFEYDSEQYELTHYKSEGVEESKNSNVIDKEITINGKKQNRAVTEIVEVNDKSIANINIGLIKLKIFDLQLDKYISRVTVQNGKGTTTTEYNNAKLAKAEIHAKQINGTIVIVEYKIKVTNIGEVEGYAKKIVDYLSTDYKFSSQLNSNWYQSGNYIYNSSLANEKIKPGESKEIKLVVTKTMTANNTGLVNNTAEIAESYNEKGLKDINSTAGNNVKGENDQDSADLILSIKTGEVIAFIVGVISIIMVITLIGVVVIKNINNKYVRKEG